MSVGQDSCDSYGPGHQIHWIQARKSYEPGQPVIAVTVVGVHDDGRVDIEGEDLTLTLWSHRPDRIRSAVAVGGGAQWKPKYHVLKLFSGDSFNLAALDEREPCVPPIRRRPTETVRQYIERAMRENHGYTVPESWLEDLDAIPDSDTGEPRSGYLVPVADSERTATDRMMLDRLRSLNPDAQPTGDADG
jgi:hypothetical protein